MAAISETLRQARLRSGIDLDRLADQTKINPRYLRAIEAGDFDKLPSGIFARMFVKQYAEAVGLDGASFAEEFQRTTSFGQEFSPDLQTIAAARRNYEPSVPGLNSVADRVRGERTASTLSSFMWVVVVILVCSGAYYGLAHLPGHLAGILGSTAANPEETPTHSANASPAPASAPPAVKQASAAKPVEATPVPPAATPAATAIQLEISTSEPVWVSATADGKPVFSETLAAGSSRTVSAADSARLTLGNAGGADITFNGKKLEPLGPKGQVRTVEFTPQNFQVISRTSATAEPSRSPDPLR